MKAIPQTLSIACPCNGGSEMWLAVGSRVVVYEMQYDKWSNGMGSDIVHSRGNIQPAMGVQEE